MGLIGALYAIVVFSIAIWILFQLVKGTAFFITAYTKSPVRTRIRILREMKRGVLGSIGIK